MSFIFAASEQLPLSDQIGVMVLAVFTCIFMGLSAVFGRIIQKQTTKTEAAVHDESGASVVEIVQALTTRVGHNETRMTDQARRIGMSEASISEAHRRIDRIEGEQTRSMREHGSRIGDLETRVAVVEAAPCMAEGHVHLPPPTVRDTEA